MSGYDAGEAFLQVVPSFRGVVEAIDREAARWGVSAGQKFAAAFDKEASKSTDKANLGPSAASSAKQGDEAGKRYADGFKARLAATKDAQVGVKVDTKDADRKVGLLTTAILGLGPAAIPIGAVAAGALAGLVPVAGTALLAVTGLEKEFKSGALQGTAFGKDIQFAQGELAKLQQIAAGNITAGLHKGFQAIRADVPGLNKDVGILSAQLGAIVGHVGPGLASLFTRLSPLFATVGTDLEHGAAAFQHWASSSQSVSRFVAYVQAELPTVESTLANLATVAGHVVQGFAPFGSTTLQAINLLSGAVAKIPVGVLQGVLPAISGAVLGGKLGGVVEDAGNKLSGWADKAQNAGGIAESLSGVTGKLGKVLGHAGTVGAIAGTALGVVSSVMGFLSKGSQEAAARINDLTAAMQNGTVAAQVWKDAQVLGVDAAQKLGLSQQQIVQAITGTEAKYKAAQAALDAYKREQDQTALAAGRFGASAQYVATQTGAALHQVQPLKDSLAELRKEYQAAQAKLAAWANQQGDANLAAQIANGSYAKIAHTLGATSDVYLAAKLAADKNTQSTKQQTLAFQLENNAAGLVNQALATMAGQNLDVAQAQTSLAQSVHAVTQSFHDNGKAIKGDSAAALSNQSAVQGNVSAARSLATAVAQQTGSNQKAIVSYRDSKRALLDQLAAQGELTPAIKAYVNRLYDVKGISDYLSHHPTNIDVNNGPAIRKLKAVETEMHRIGHGVDAVVNVTTTYRGGGRNTVKAEADGGILNFASGGILGPLRKALDNALAPIRHYADGAHVAQIAPAGAWRVWAEPETGGEAYVPLAPAKRARSESILSSVAQRFGGTYVPPSMSFALGGLVPPAHPMMSRADLAALAGQRDGRTAPIVGAQYISTMDPESAAATAVRKLAFVLH